ncbi:MAG: M28 family metallopeptidase [Robiginitomaculum sp.]|nr:M28 family metallopeptidase [Robiginitomaculum sp.]
MTISKTLCLVTAALVITNCAPSKPEMKTPEKPSISAADIGRRIETLADDRFEGRAPGTNGGLMASQYIADEMKAADIAPMGIEGTYFQPITLTETTVSVGSYMKIGATNYTAGKDAVYWTKHYQDTVTVSDSDLVFVGYGVVAPEYGWNDYAGVDVKGKTVVMLVNDPGFATKDENLFKGNAMTYYGRWTYKFEEAGRQGAAGVLVIHETEPASYGWNVVSGGWTGPQIDLIRPDKGATRSTLEGWLTIDSAKDLFKTANLNFTALKTAASQKGFKPVPMDGLKLNAQINNTISTVKSRNVVGVVKGTKYPDEYVLYMAHWDHKAMKTVAEGEDGIYNGAVDNATGTSAILEIGEAFAVAPAERSVLIVAVTAEESGLLGSAYYGEDPIVPLNKTVAGINVDGMLPLGRTKDVVVVGYGASELDGLLEAVVKPRGMYLIPDPKPEAGYYYRSDHISLAKKGVPFLYADAGIDHETKGKEYGTWFGDDYTANRYHAPSDEYDNSWDLSGIEQMTEIFYELGNGIANSRDWPNWNKTAEFRSLRDEMMKTKD